MPSPLSRLIAKELNLTEQQVENVINLLQEGASIPFIARYRKELTGSLNELSIIAIRDRLKQLTELEKRRDSVIHSVREQGKLTEELEQALRRATTLTEIEDLYLPFRPKRKTRASMAIEKGLEPLAKTCASLIHHIPSSGCMYANNSLTLLPINFSLVAPTNSAK